jgi:hypothetical protein
MEAEVIWSLRAFLSIFGASGSHCSGRNTPLQTALV